MLLAHSFMCLLRSVLILSAMQSFYEICDFPHEVDTYSADMQVARRLLAGHILRNSFLNLDNNLLRMQQQQS